MQARKKKIVALAVVAVLCLLVLVTRVVYDGRTALAEGDAFAAKQDMREAVFQWRRAARWYAPLVSHVDDAYQRMEQLAEKSAAEGDDELALLAWRGIRSSILATRSFYTPRSELLDKANQKIATLVAAADTSPVGEGTDRRAFHLELLEKTYAPHVGFTLLALLGLALWVGGGFLFAFRGLDENDRLVRKWGARSGALIVVGLLLWVLGLYWA